MVIGCVINYLACMLAIYKLIHNLQKLVENIGLKFNPPLYFLYFDMLVYFQTSPVNVKTTIDQDKTSYGKFTLNFTLTQDGKDDKFYYRVYIKSRSIEVAAIQISHNLLY